MIRPSVAADLPAIADIYEEILAAEEARPASYTNWMRGKYPTLSTARGALEAGTLWTAEEHGEVYGAAILNGVQLPEYDAIPWQFPADRDQVAVIHTLVISPRWAGRGKARETVRRLDTYEGNVPANAMYPRLGYHLAGGTEFFFQGFIHEVLNCYEKRL